jgi:hypothetical protein
VKTNERPAPGKHAAEGKRFRRAVPLVTAAAVSAAMVASAAGPASAAAREPAQTAPGLLASGADAGALPSAAALAAAAPYVHVADGRVTFDAAGAQKAGVSSQALGAEGAVAAGLNQLLGHESTLAGSAHNGMALNVAGAVPAALQDTTIQVLPGITLTINGTGIQLNMTKEAVTEVESVAGFGQTVASLVGSILSASGNPLGGQIASIVAASLGVGSGFLKLCSAGDGSATFTVPWFGIPSCSGLTIFP